MGVSELRLDQALDSISVTTERSTKALELDISLPRRLPNRIESRADGGVSHLDLVLEPTRIFCETPLTGIGAVRLNSEGIAERVSCHAARSRTAAFASDTETHRSCCLRASAFDDYDHVFCLRGVDTRFLSGTCNGIRGCFGIGSPVSPRNAVGMGKAFSDEVTACEVNEGFARGGQGFVVSAESEVVTQP